MVTKNWVNAFNAYRAGMVIPGGIIDIHGVTQDAGYRTGTGQDYLLLKTLNIAFDANYGQGICLGSGTTPPTLDDYKLEAFITSGLSVSLSKAFDANNNVTWTITASNTSDQPITIGEVGVQGVVYMGNNGGNAAYVIFDRTVLESPITIEPGGVGQVTYTIRLNYPTT